MIGAPNSLNLNCKVRVMKEAPGPSVSEEIADIFRNYNIDPKFDIEIFICWISYIANSIRDIINSGFHLMVLDIFWLHLEIYLNRYSCISD